MHYTAKGHETLLREVLIMPEWTTPRKGTRRDPESISCGLKDTSKLAL